jgi:uncharacterized protein (DUF1330 family)
MQQMCQKHRKSPAVRSILCGRQRVLFGTVGASGAVRPIKPSWRNRESRSSSTHQRAGVSLRIQARFNSLEKPMPAYVIFDVDIRDADQYRAFMTAVKPALEAVGARYLVRGGAHKVYEGDWQPRRIVLLEFPSVEVWEAFYHGPTYQGLKAVRDACSSARLVGVEGA